MEELSVEGLAIPVFDFIPLITYFSRFELKEKDRKY
jgi:hypothetical protein